MDQPSASLDQQVPSRCASCPLTSVSDWSPVAQVSARILLFVLTHVLFPPHADALSLSAVMLAALLLCARGASIGHAPADSPVDDASGDTLEEPTEAPTEEHNNVFAPAVSSAEQCVKNFAAEFHLVEPFVELNNYKSSQLPTDCPSSFSKEACLKSVVEGLQTYIVLLKFVESQYANNVTVSHTKRHTENLKCNLVQMMKNPQRVTVLSSSQEEQLLNGTQSYKDLFSRKMAANWILKELHEYLKCSKRNIINRNARPAKRPQHHSICTTNKST
ncbi:interleukin-6-like [Betta splendens]|uniref:Interleukin-6 n=1 Tax=Betta splendens TaxID=158456 RepID=A0A9W2Y542_BETSP|nr:interleukin-6-like [Betta splendens]